MAAGDVRQGLFNRNQSQGGATVAGLVGGTTYAHLKVKSTGMILIGNSTVDPNGASDTNKGYRLQAGEEFVLQNAGGAAGLIDGAKITLIAAEGSSRNLSITIFAIDNV